MGGGNELVAVPERQTFGEGGRRMAGSHNDACADVSGESEGGRSGGEKGKKNEIVSLKNLSPSMTGTETDLCISRSFAHAGTSPIDHEHPTPLPRFKIPNPNFVSPPSHGGGHLPHRTLHLLRESVHSLTEQAAHSPARFSLHPLPLAPTR
jgi:hypothetical protein